MQNKKIVNEKEREMVKGGKMRSLPDDETLDVATYLRLLRAAASRARLRNKFTLGFHFS